MMKINIYRNVVYASTCISMKTASSDLSFHKECNYYKTIFQKLGYGGKDFKEIELRYSIKKRSHDNMWHHQKRNVIEIK